jgi:hypothetical protein
MASTKMSQLSLDAFVSAVLLGFATALFAQSSYGMRCAAALCCQHLH